MSPCNFNALKLQVNKDKMQKKTSKLVVSTFGIFIKAKKYIYVDDLMFLSSFSLTSFIKGS